jgi:hypothetical protein
VRVSGGSQRARMRERQLGTFRCRGAWIWDRAGRGFVMVDQCLCVVMPLPADFARDIEY